MRVPASIFFREFKKSIAPVMAREGFSLTQSAYLCWNRPFEELFVTVWVMCDDRGWNSEWGSRFTVEFVLSKSPDPSIRRSEVKSQRLGYLLEGFEELDELRVLSNEVISRLPGHNNPASALAQFGLAPKVDSQKAIYGRDMWLHYYSTKDARSWGAHVGKILPKCIAIFERGNNSPQALARARWNEMMGRFQRATGIEAKQREINNYIVTEEDANFRRSAENWLQQFNEYVAELRSAQQGAQAGGPQSGPAA